MGLRVAIAEDSYLIREALRELLTGVPELEVVAVCEDTRGLMGAIERESPDVVMSDIRMPPFAGVGRDPRGRGAPPDPSRGRAW